MKASFGILFRSALACLMFGRKHNLGENPTYSNIIGKYKNKKD